MGEMVQIKVENFSGPIDLLLDLIDREELDITALSLAEVTDQYWKEIETEGTDDPDVLAEFINVGSKLLFIKSCALLPSAKPPDADLDTEIDQTAEELAAMLADHKRFKDAVDLFRQLEEEGRRTFARMAPVRNVPLPPGLEGVTLDTLLSAVKKALAEKPAESEDEEIEDVIHIEPVTVTEKMAEVKGKLAGGNKLRFKPLLDECRNRTEIVVLFLAILEMIKGGELWAEQDTPFGDIELVEAEPADAQPETADVAAR
jgi:segregation and condensation protein A